MRFKFLILLVICGLCLGLAAPAMAEGEAVATATETAAPERLTGYISGDKVNLRVEPQTSAAVKQVLAKGTAVTILEVRDMWLKVGLADQTEGWVYREYLKTGSNRAGFRSRTEAVISYARRFIGSRYRYGGISAQGFDCSGFTRFVYSQFGYKLPHNAASQIQFGAAVQKSDLLPGDLLFFSTLGAKYINHVGIYIGAGQFIHASSGSGRVRISPLDEGYYLRAYRGARRLLEPGVWDGETAPGTESQAEADK